VDERDDLVVDVDQRLRVLGEVEGVESIHHQPPDRLQTAIGPRTRPGRILPPLHVRIGSGFEDGKGSLEAFVVHGLGDSPHDLHVLLRHCPPSICG
jgi:hypothetical protein